MSEEINKTTKKSISPDWLIRGVLGKLGEIFDTLTGRKWQPSSNLATSELAEKLIVLLDSNIKDMGVRGKFVPHFITLKVQWDKFSTDSENALLRLETELLSAAVDHINDFHLHTFAPLKIEVKTDYFVKGVVLNTSFENSDEENGINLSVSELGKPIAAALEKGKTNLIRTVKSNWVIDNQEKISILKFSDNKRLSVGRSSQNDLQIDDSSVSKIHASLRINQENQLSVADTGSTNGTFINDQRISYGQSFTIETGDRIRFGSIEVNFEPVVDLSNLDNYQNDAENSFTIGEFEFRNSKTDLDQTLNHDVSIADSEKTHQ